MGHITITNTDSNKTIDCMVGQDVRIALTENPTTGYKWTYEVEGGEVILVSDNYNLPQDAAIGGEGTRAFLFKISSKGLLQINFKLCRAWEKNTTGIKNFSVNLNTK